MKLKELVVLLHLLQLGIVVHAVDVERQNLGRLQDLDLDLGLRLMPILQHEFVDYQ